MPVLVDLTLKSTLLLAGAWVASVALRGRPAAWRHVVWCAALAAVAVLPVMTAVLPAIRFTVPDALGIAETPLFSATAVGEAGGSPAQAASTGVRRAASAGATARPNWIRWVPGAWAAGAALTLGHLLIGLLQIARLRRRALPVDDPEWLADLARAARILGVTRVALLESAEAGVPMASGTLRPAVCIPPAARAWDGERRRMVLLHELAHVMRNDPLTHLAARIALCLYWFHPLAWMSIRALLRERERACDDLVLEAGARPSHYAGHLLEVAASMTPASAGWAGLWMAQKSQLEGRLVSILDAKAKRGAVGPAFTAAAALAALLVTVPVAAMRPEPQAPPANAAEMDGWIRNAIAARDRATIERTLNLLLKEHRFQEAEKLAGAAVTIRELKYGPHSPEYAQGLLQQAGIQRAAGNMSGAEETQARMAALEKAGDPAMLLAMAHASIRKKDFERAVDLCQRSAANAPDAKTRGEALAWLGLARELSNDLDGAEQNYQGAVQAAEPGTTGQATALELFARLMRQRGRLEEATAAETRAKEIRAANVRGTNLPLNTTGASASKVGAGVQPPKLIYKIEPQYTEVAKTAKCQGRVKLAVVIGTDGQASRVDLADGIGFGLDEQAVEAVRQWRFQPGTKDGQPVTVMATIEVNFRLI